MQNRRTTSSNFRSRFGYIMVAAGAAIGLGNIWKFPYMAYKGGGIFIILYILFAILLGHPLIEMESAIGRYARTNAIDAYGVIHHKYRFIGFINVLCTLLINMYYIIVSGYVLKYALDYLNGTDFGFDKAAYYISFISDPVSPMIYAGTFMLTIILFLSFGITTLVEKITKIIMPLLFLLLAICGIWALFSSDTAIEGLKYYLIPDFSKLNSKIIADAAMQIMFSISVGWAVFPTLGASLSDDANIRKDSFWITFCDTFVALLAGFVIIPSVVGSGSAMTAGPSLIFLAMPAIFDTLPGGRIIGCFFFLALIFAVVSTYFTILEVPVRCLKEKCHISHGKATFITTSVIMTGALFCSLSQGNGLLSHIKLPWWVSGEGIIYYNIYNWIDCFSSYVLLPLGCLLTSYYCCFVWGHKKYANELTKNGRDGFLSLSDRLIMTIVIPILTIIVILNCFGFIK